MTREIRGDQKRQGPGDHGEDFGFTPSHLENSLKRALAGPAFCLKGPFCCRVPWENSPGAARAEAGSQIGRQEAVAEGR